MKKNIHPKTHTVVFKDVSTDMAFLTSTTLTSNETIQWKNGETYPLIKVDVSSSSHPFYTQQNRALDTHSRAEKFRKKYEFLSK